MDKQIVIYIKSGTMKGFEISLCWPAGEFFCYSFTVTGGRCSPAYIRQSWFVTQSNTLPHFSLQSHWVPGHCLQTSECPLRGSTWRPGSCWQTWKEAHTRFLWGKTKPTLLLASVVKYINLLLLLNKWLQMSSLMQYRVITSQFPYVWCLGIRLPIQGLGKLKRRCWPS